MRKEVVTIKLLEKLLNAQISGIPVATQKLTYNFAVHTMPNGFSTKQDRLWSFQDHGSLGVNITEQQIFWVVFFFYFESRFRQSNSGSSIFMYNLIVKRTLITWFCRIYIFFLIQVITYDARNHGDSDGSTELDYPCMTQDLSDLIDSQGSTQNIVMGHSMGGKTVMTLALTKVRAEAFHV